MRIVMQSYLHACTCGKQCRILCEHDMYPCDLTCVHVDGAPSNLACVHVAIYLVQHADICSYA